MNMYSITLLRHGESEGNSGGILQGQSDYLLTPLGEQQARNLADYWKAEGKHFDLIISSPLLRASKTAEIIATHLHCPIKLEPMWMERNFGHFQGEKLSEIQKLTPAVDYFHPFEQIGLTGESQLDVYNRASRALQEILRDSPGEYLVVSHGSILNKALFAIMGITPQGHYHSPIFQFGNTGYAQFRYNPINRQWAVIGLNNQAANIINKEDFTWNSD